MYTRATMKIKYAIRFSGCLWNHEGIMFGTLVFGKLISLSQIKYNIFVNSTFTETVVIFSALLVLKSTLQHYVPVILTPNIIFCLTTRKKN